MLKNILSQKKGISIVEVIIASAIISLFMIGVSDTYSNFLKLSIENTYKTQAVFLLDEGSEAMKVMRSYAWSDISSSTANTYYYLIWSNNRWYATTTVNIVDDMFIRKYTVEDVYRDPNTLNVVYNGGTLDNNSKIINMEVEWNYKNSTTTKKTSFYLFNIYE